MKRIFILFLLALVIPSYAVPVDSIPFVMPNGVSRKANVDANGNIIVSGITVTLGSTTLSINPIYSDIDGSGTLALVDSSRRIVITIGSETLGLITQLAAANTKIASLSAQQASETLDVIAAIASSSSSSSPGILGTFTLSIPADTVVALPTAPTGAKSCKFLPTQDINFGGSDVGSGTLYNYFYQDVPGQGFFGWSDFTSIRLIGRTAIATATGFWY